MNIRNLEQRNVDIALYETNRELKSQRLELYQAHQWADQAHRELDKFMRRTGNEKQTLPRKSREKFPRNWGFTKNLLRRNRSSQTIENWWISCLRNRRGILLLWVGSWLKRRILQNTANSLADGREFLRSCDSEQVWSVPRSIQSPRGVLRRDYVTLTHDAQAREQYEPNASDFTLRSLLMTGLAHEQDKTLLPPQASEARTHNSMQRAGTGAPRLICSRLWKNATFLWGTRRHVALTSDTGIDAPCDSLPGASASKLSTPWTCWVRMNSALSSSNTSAISVWGDDSAISYPRWICLQKLMQTISVKKNTKITAWINSNKSKNCNRVPPSMVQASGGQVATVTRRNLVVMVRRWLWRCHLAVESNFPAPTTVAFFDRKGCEQRNPRMFPRPCLQCSLPWH